MRTHTGETPFECDQCDAKFARKSHLTAHMLSHAAVDQKPFKCPECGKGVNTKQHYDQHMKIHARPYSCPRDGCDAKFRMEIQLTRHIAAHDRTCCGTVYPTQKKYLTHVERNHSNRYHCGCCLSKFDTFPELQRHLTTHKAAPDETPVEPAVDSAIPAKDGETNRADVGNEADEASSRESSVGPTISRITGVGYDERPIECPEGCGRRFFRQYDLERHLASAHD